ncbi:MAG: hypothetical protein WC996_10020 [Peptostreptococcales bacterium]
MKIKKRYYAYLLYLIIVTLIVTGVSFSRYQTIVESSATASVAKPVLAYVPVSATLNGVELTKIQAGIDVSEVLPGDELVYQFKIRNFEGTESNIEVNQVLLKYIIHVTFDPSVPNLPLTYDIEPTGVYPSAGGNWTYLSFGSQITHSYTLTVSWDESEIDPIYKDKQQSIHIQIDAEQADY